MELKFCPNCGAERTGKRCLKCGASFSRAGRIALLIVGVCLVFLYLAFRLVVNESQKAVTVAAYSTTREEIDAYDRAAESVREKLRHLGLEDMPVAPFSAQQIGDLGDGRYRIDVPYQGFDYEAKPETKIATCLVHCDRGLCYVDTVTGFSTQ
jgi:hypothetical protein